MPADRHRAGARAPERARVAAGRAPGARSSATCRRSSTSAGSRRASGRRSRRRRRKLHGARAGAARTARRRSAAGSTSGSTSGCATRGARSTRSSTRSKTQTDALAADAERRMAPRLIPTGETGAARAEARAAIDAIGERLRDAGGRRRRRAPPAANRPRQPAVGDRVLVGALRARRRRAGAARARRRGRRPRQAAARAGRRAARRRRRRRRCSASRRGCASTSTCSRARASLTELNVIGCNVDEALGRVEKFLDEALVSELQIGAHHPRLRHRAAAPRDRRVLSTHPFVAQLRARAREPGRRRRSTVVELKD